MSTFDKSLVLCKFLCSLVSGWQFFGWKIGLSCQWIPHCFDFMNIDNFECKILRWAINLGMLNHCKLWMEDRVCSAGADKKAMCVIFISKIGWGVSLHLESHQGSFRGIHPGIHNHTSSDSQEEEVVANQFCQLSISGSWELFMVSASCWWYHLVLGPECTRYRVWSWWYLSCVTFLNPHISASHFIMAHSLMIYCCHISQWASFYGLACNLHLNLLDFWLVVWLIG